MRDKQDVTVAHIKRRLRRLEGQLKGIERMIDQDACCSDLLVQIAAVRAAISKVGILLFENHVQDCLAKSFAGDDEKSRQETLENLLKVMNSFIK